MKRFFFKKKPNVLYIYIYAKKKNQLPIAVALIYNVEGR